jgi:hypothetical protein
MSTSLLIYRGGSVNIDKHIGLQKTGGSTIELHHPLDGVTNPEYKLLHFIQLTKFFVKRRRH